MAIVVHLVERTENDGDNDVRNDIHAVLVAIDDAVDTTGALIQARAVTVCQANGQDLPTGYFDTNRLVSTTLDAADDVVVCARKVVENIA